VPFGHDVTTVPAPDHREGSSLGARGLRKRFDGVEVLHGVDLELRGGEVHALVGENGAGKSTLINLLSGRLQPDDGVLELNGAHATFRNPLSAKRAGISAIAQELDVVPTLTVVENIFLGVEPTRVGLVRWRDARREAVEVMRDLGVAVDPDRVVGDMSVADQQLVEIAKAMVGDFSMLIMDEPTSALNLHEIERLFVVIRKLKDAGVGILYVSHRLWEIFDLADRVTVLRDGHRIVTKAIADTDVHEIVVSMLGHERAPLGRAAAARRPGELAASGERESVLEVEGLTVGDVVADVRMVVGRGEIVGLAGVLGSGRTEVCEAIYGIRKIDAGVVRLRDREVAIREPKHAISTGIFMVAEDRKSAGILSDLDTRENVVLNYRPRATGGDRQSRMARGTDPIRSRAELQAFQAVRASLGIRVTDPRQRITALSGGNQQKALFARAALARPDVLLLCEPTRGVDVGAKEEIYATIERFADEGAAIVVSSSEVTELLRIADRIYVLRHGRILAELTRAEMTEAEILRRMAG
jgi:ABC-type sugar transport system ATPase subunit